MRGVDDDTDSDRRKGSFCHGSESEEEGDGAKDVYHGNARSNDPRRPAGRKPELAPTPLPKAFPWGQKPPVRVNANKCGRRTCAWTTSDWGTFINGNVLI